MPSPRTVRITYVTGVVLQAIEQGYRYGFDIMDVSGLPDGTVYPALRRLEEAGLLSARWEEGASAHRDKRPPRRYYELTSAGVEALEEARRRFHGLAAARSPAEPAR